MSDKISKVIFVAALWIFSTILIVHREHRGIDRWYAAHPPCTITYAVPHKWAQEFHCFTSEGKEFPCNQPCKSEAPCRFEETR
jgi:hypothetical protein